MNAGSIRWFQNKGWLYTADDPISPIQEVESRGLSRAELLRAVIGRMRYQIMLNPILRFYVRIFNADGALADERRIDRE